MKLTTIIITKNEEKWIENCLKSVQAISDEIVVVDNSSDKTADICKKFGAKVYSHEWEGFSEQKNYALSKATGAWIFFIDADERVSKELSREIEKIKSDLRDDTSHYAVPRRNILLGQKMAYGGWWPDHVTRLAVKEKIGGWSGKLHESLNVMGGGKKLNGQLYHLSHRGMQWMLAKSMAYTRTEAETRFKAGHPSIQTWRFFRVMLTEFWDRLFVKSGWRDGTVGWIEAISQAFNMFLVYEQIWEMQKGQTMEKLYEQIDSDLTDHGF